MIPICLWRLLTEHDLSNIPNLIYQLISVIHRFPFDHLIPEIEDTTYTTVQYWCLQSMVHQINPEKKWGVSSIVNVDFLIKKSRTSPSVVGVCNVQRKSYFQVYKSDVYMTSCV